MADEFPCNLHSGVCERLKGLEKLMEDHSDLLKDGQKMFESLRNRLTVLTFAVAVLCSLIVIAGIVGSEGGFIGFLKAAVGK